MWWFPSACSFGCKQRWPLRWKRRSGRCGCSHFHEFLPCRLCHERTRYCMTRRCDTVIFQWSVMRDTFHPDNIIGKCQLLTNQGKPRRWQGTSGKLGKIMPKTDYSLPSSLSILMTLKGADDLSLITSALTSRTTLTLRLYKRGSIEMDPNKKFEFIRITPEQMLKVKRLLLRQIWIPFKDQS